MNNFGDGIRKRKAPRIEARGRRPGQKPCPGALIGRETVSRKVAAASPFEKIGEEAARIAARGSRFSISHKHGRNSTTVGRPSGTFCPGLSHKRCSEGGRSLHLRGPRDCLRFRTLGWIPNERSATEKLFALRLSKGFSARNYRVTPRLWQPDFGWDHSGVPFAFSMALTTCSGLFDGI